MKLIRSNGTERHENNSNSYKYEYTKFKLLHEIKNISIN